MTNSVTPQSLSFVFQAAEIHNVDIRALHENNIRPIVDLTGQSSSAAAGCFDSLGITDIKLTCEQFLSAEVRTILGKRTKPARALHLWLEYHGEHQGIRLEDIAAANVSENPFQISLITGNLGVMQRVIDAFPDIFSLALKGCESSGFVSSETTLCLLSHIEDIAHRKALHPVVDIWGGVFTAAGAAALLFSGVRSVAFESLHWLTGAITSFDETQQKRLASLRLDHSSLLPLSSSLCFRAYNKGNSAVVGYLIKMLAAQAKDDSALVPVIGEIRQHLKTAQDSEFSIDDLIPLGAEASFALAFKNYYGEESNAALIAFAGDVRKVLSHAAGAREKMLQGKIAADLGVRYPFIQGGMAWISDSTDFASQVSEAGALPTIALGIKNREALDRMFSSLPQRLTNQAYAVNVITLAENPHRDEQIAWIKEVRPPYVVISAGDPAFGASLQQQGQRVIYVTSDLGLLEVAWKSGIRYVVLEGSEAGGHIGSMTTLTLAQAALHLKSVTPEYSDKYLILAGGIFNANTLHRAAILGADAVQMGTVYLSTEEITASGALSPIYQKVVLESGFGDTRITGCSTGLRVRSILSPKIREIDSLEASMQKDGVSEATARKRLEEVGVGSLYVAARCCDPVSRTAISNERCYAEGQFMSGAVAGNLSTTTTLEKLHALLAEAPFHKLLSPGLTRCAAVPRATGERIAITGMAMSNALGNDPDKIWQACLNLQSGITTVPKSRWDHSQYFTDSACHQGQTYCRVAAFQSLDITRKDLGISPHDFRTMTDSTRLTLWLAGRAIEQSGILSSAIPRERIGVLVSQNSGESGSTIEDLTLSVISADLARRIQTGLGLEEEARNDIERIITHERIAIDDTTLLGRLNCAAGGFICNRYGFTGPSFSVSAACATGLVALYSAIQLIKNGILDAAIVGGGEELLHPASFLEFSALGALAGKDRYGLEPADYSRPFDKNRSGMVLGEGGGMIVIERESQARSRGAQIYACITGVGASNNHKGMVESVAETQQLAINASFKDAGYGPDQVDLIECHATSTKTGDVEEIKALKTIYPKGCTTVLSSFKSQIGHTLGSSGLNSLIRGICAMRAKTLPPTLNYTTPDPELDLESWGFRVCGTPIPWPDNNRARRFQVNAFGFGGANYVVQLEEADRSSEDVNHGQEPQMAIMPQRPAEAIADNGCGVLLCRASHQGNQYRIGTCLNQGRLQTALQPHLGTLANMNKLQQRHLAKEGVFVRVEQPAAPCALVFAGQGSHYFQMGKQLYHTFPVIRRWMDTIAELADFDILDLMFNSKEENLRKTQWQQPALFVLEYAIYQQLAAFGFSPTALAGHSMGELTALCVADSFSYKDAFRIINKRAQCMERASREALDPGGMIAVDVPFDVLEEMVGLNDNLYFTNFNSPHQIVVGGSTQAIARFKEELDNRKYWNVILPVSMAFHSPIMRIIRDELGDYLGDIAFSAPAIPVVSNTTGKPYPDDPREIKKIIVAHLESPVLWQDNVTTLADDFGCRLFVEVGPQDTLCKLIGDIAPQTESISTCSKEAEVETLRFAICRLFAAAQIEPASPHCHIDLTVPAHSSNKEREETEIDTDRVRQIIQREINSFALQGVEKFLKPAILKAILDELGHRYNPAELDSYLGTSPSSYPVPQLTQTPFPPARQENIADISEQQDVILEKVIAIIMDATGYEREEIAAEMDIRQDLSIRSSRLPVIMNAAEERFDIVIKLEDFMDVRTIGDFADRVKEVMARQGTPLDGHENSFTVPKMPREQTRVSQMTEILPVQRLVFREIELEVHESNELFFNEDDHIAILSFASAERSAELHSMFTRKFSARVSLFRPTRAELNAHTLLFGEEEKISALIIATDMSLSADYEIASLGQLSTSIYSHIRKTLQSPARKCCIHISFADDNSQLRHVLCRGILGILLAGALEYGSVLFRSMEIGGGSSFEAALSAALNKANTIIDMIARDNLIYTTQLSASPIAAALHAPAITAEDVILISGGTRGISAAIARSLAGLGGKLILIGRTSQDHTKSIEKGQISSLVANLQECGCEAHYFQCDITDPDQVRKLAGFLAQFGPVTGLIHGAGILRDNFIPLQDSADFKRVIDVKFSGLLNLISIVNPENLKFAAVLSSIAAITGNVGQANYCSANRLMAAALPILVKDSPTCRTRAFWLPPIEGAGMAEDADIKEIIKANVGEQAFLDVEEIAAIIVSELQGGKREEKDIIPARQLPLLSTLTAPKREDQTLWFDTANLDMVDEIVHLDWRNASVIGTRTLDHSRDLWLKEHQPFVFLKQPITSAVMVLESFLETACMLAPLSFPFVLRRIRFMKMLETPLNETTATFTLCRKTKTSVIECRLGKLRRAGGHVTPDDIDSHFSGQVICLVPATELSRDDGLVRVSTESTFLSQEQMMQCYESRSALKGRYRVLSEISACEEGSISGWMIYPDLQDFSPPSAKGLFMPVYALEAIMQLAGFHAGLQMKNKQTAVPTEIELLSVMRNCVPLEKIEVQAILIRDDGEKMIWKGAAYDAEGKIILNVTGLKMTRIA